MAKKKKQPDIIVHLSDWNFNDKAYAFPHKHVKTLIKKMKALRKNQDMSSKKVWEYFYKRATLTVGVENADVFLDFAHPKECALEWEEYFY